MIAEPALKQAAAAAGQQQPATDWIVVPIIHSHAVQGLLHWPEAPHREAEEAAEAH